MLKLLINKPKRLIGLALLLSLTVSAAAMLSLHEMRVDAFERAKDAGANIALVIEHDITRNLEFYSLSLQNVADRLADPEVRRLPDHVQRMVLFDGRIQAQDLGSMLVTDREGRVILDSKSNPRARSTSATATISCSRPRATTWASMSASRSRRAPGSAWPSPSACA